MANYKLTVGIETHVQFNTKTKLFSGASNDDRNSKPNSLVNHIDFGLPGALPVLNKEAIEKAIRAAFALNSEPTLFSTFDRKHYFYPDLPMGYQITQYNQPIIGGGYVEFYLEGKLHKIGITRAHLEADAGKSIHPDNQDYTLIDLNRAGTPLLEIVSEPDIYSAEEAKAYAQELWLLMRYADVSNANLFFGNMRFDVNVSVSTDDKLGTRTETKNLNSFRSIERAVEYEMKRQIELLERGEKIIQETRGWNDSENKNYSLRTKENADDYRYMPDPDLPPVVLEKEYVSEVKKSMPKLPNEWRALLNKHALDNSVIDSLLTAEVEYESPNLNYISQLLSDKAKAIANWIVNIELPLREAENSITLPDDLRHKLYEQVLDLYNSEKLNSSAAKEILVSLLTQPELPASIEEYASGKDLIQQSDPKALKGVVSKVIKENPKAAEDIKAGELKAIGFLVGQVMKLSKNQANPSLVQKLIKEELAE